MENLEAVSLYKTYENKPLLNGMNFRVESGETLCLLGRSGSGKSTILRIIAGLEKPDSGAVYWNGQDIAEVPTYNHFGSCSRTTRYSLTYCLKRWLWT
jgi:ABC-type Fe3+/spermidine/putrescine transport system ATPase subunit